MGKKFFCSAWFIMNKYFISNSPLDIPILPSQMESDVLVLLMPSILG